MKKFGAFLVLIFCLGLIILPSERAFSKDLYVSIATGGTGGVFYPAGGAISDLIRKHCPSVKGATAEVTAASLENVKLVNSGQSDFAMMSWVAVVSAGMKDKIPNVRSVFLLHGSPRQWIVLADSKIHSLLDFKGKRVVVGAPGSATEECSRAVFELIGLSFDDIKPAFLSFREGVEALKDNRVDVACVQAGFPTSTVMDINTVRDIRLINISKKNLEKIEKAFPSMPPITIPAGTYRGQDQDVHTWNTPGPMICNKDLPEQAVYEIVKVLHKHKDWLVENVHRFCKYWEFSPVVQKYCPLHPGAARYYKEIGLLK